MYTLVCAHTHKHICIHMYAFFGGRIFFFAQTANETCRVTV